MGKDGLLSMDAKPVVKGKDFVFAAMSLEHGHIYDMCKGLCTAGGCLKWVYDPDPEKLRAFTRRFPQVKIARDEDEILQDTEVRMVAAADVPAKRCALGLRVMDSGKDYFTDKAPMTTREQLEQAREKVKETGRMYAVFYSERVGTESGVYAGQLIEAGAIGKVIQVIGMGPHRLGALPRPDWFYDRELAGGILCDIGSHQVEQFLFYSGAKDATVTRSQVGNFGHPEHPGLEDFGDCMLLGDNGSTNYFRVDWFTPDGLGTWGDGRTFILGTDGYIELRKFINVGVDPSGEHVFLVDHHGERHIPVAGTVGCPYFGELILDSLNRTENAMSQEHAFKAAQICLIAQREAVRIGNG